MRYYTDARGRLVFAVDQEEQTQLFKLYQDHPSEFDNDATMHTLFLNIIANTEFGWIQPFETGDLTDAPMLGFRDNTGGVICRWAHMNYQVSSIQTELMRKGRSEWPGGDIRENRRVKLPVTQCSLNFEE